MEDVTGLSDLQVLDELSLMRETIHLMRNDRWDHTRLSWDDHVDQLIHKSRFEREDRMTYSAYSDLVRLLDPLLERGES